MLFFDYQTAAKTFDTISRNKRFDDETRELLSKLNEDLDEIAAGSQDTLSDSARELESRFAATHPVAERITREIADLLAKMGI